MLRFVLVYLGLEACVHILMLRLVLVYSGLVLGYLGIRSWYILLVLGACAGTPGSRFMRLHIMRIRSYATILNVPAIRFMREKFHIMRCCAVVYARWWPTVTQWWKAFNIRQAISNIGESWKEVKSSTLNSVWKSVWKEAIHTFTGLPSFSGTVQECVNLAHRVGGEGFSDLETDDVLELLDSHDEELSVDDLLELSAAQEQADEAENDVALDIKEMTMKEMAAFFKLANNLAQAAMDMDHSLERSQHFSRGLKSILAPYQEIYAKKQNSARQTTMTKFFKPTNSTSPPPEATQPPPEATQPPPEATQSPPEATQPPPEATPLLHSSPAASPAVASPPEDLPDIAEDPDDPTPLF